MTEHTDSRRDDDEQTQETDDDFVTSQLYPLTTHEWFDGSEQTC